MYAGYKVVSGAVGTAVVTGLDYTSNKYTVVIECNSTDGQVYTVKHKVVGGSRWVASSGNSDIVSDTATPLTISGAEEIQVVAQVNAGTEEAPDWEAGDEPFNVVVIMEK